MMTREKITTRSAEETRKAAADFVDRILSGGADMGTNGARLVCLWGDLGSGKTTFTQGAAARLGVKKAVNSPTFLIMKKYLLAGGYKNMNLYHFDLYRVSDKRELLDLGWEEILADKHNLVVVEWPEKIADILPQTRIDIRFKQMAADERRIEFYY